MLNYDYYYRCTTVTIQLETALCYQHCFCNTELRTAIITKIKGLSIQAQQNTFVLFTLLQLTSDERKTLTKVSTRKPLTTIPQKPVHASDTKEQENWQKAVCRETPIPAVPAASQKPMTPCIPLPRSQDSNTSLSTLSAPPVYRR